MKIKLKLQNLAALLVPAYLVLMAVKDFGGVKVPGIMFLGIWGLILLFASSEVAAAFTLSTVICFSSTMSVTIPMVVYVVITLLKRKRLRVNALLMVSLYVIVTELLRFLFFPSQQFVGYATTVVGELFLFTILTALDDGVASPELCLKFYLVFFTFLALEIIWVTAEELGGLSQIISSRFRLGMLGEDEEAVAEGLLSINPNGIALMAISAITATMLLQSKKHISMIWAVPALVFFSLVGFLTVSKTFILVYAGFWCLYLIWYTVRYKKSMVRTLGLLVLAVILLIAIWNTDMIQNVVRRFDTNDQTSGRIDIILEYLDYMMKEPARVVFGIGPQDVTGKVGAFYSPHNAITEIFVCFGFVGLALYAGFFGSLLRTAHRKRALQTQSGGLINMIPFICYAVFIQALQFRRVGYIYFSVALCFAGMLVNDSRGKERAKSTVE